MEIVNIKNKTSKKHSVYIGRPGPFGNPFVIGKDGTRDEVIAKFRTYALNNPAMLRHIASLKEHDILGCFCKPQACHGDVIRDIYFNHL